LYIDLDELLDDDAASVLLAASHTHASIHEAEEDENLGAGVGRS
jgi:hypothetical protein